MYQQLAYLMRSGAPDSLDRMVAMSFGHLAVNLSCEGRLGRWLDYMAVNIPMYLSQWSWPVKRRWMYQPSMILRITPKDPRFMGVPCS